MAGINPRYHKHFETFKRNMLVLGKAISPGTFQVPSARFHEEIAEIIVDPKIKLANVVAPRAHAKSSIVAGVGPLWYLFIDAMMRPDQDPEPRFVLLLSKSLHHATKLLGTIRDVIEYSPHFREVFGYWGRQAHDTRFTQTDIQLKNGSYILARGMGQHIRGIKKGNMRPNLVIGDDFEDQENTKTEERMNNNWDWLHTELIPAMNPLNHKFVNIATPQNDAAICMRLKDVPNWHNRHYKAIVDPEVLAGTKAPYPEAALWNEWLSVDALMEKKAELESFGNLSYFYREYQCEVIGDEEQLFNPENDRYWDGQLETRKTGINEWMHFLVITHMDLVLLEKPLILPVTVFGGIDLASSTSNKAAHSTFVSVAVDQRGNRYILPYERVRERPYEFAQRVIRVYKRIRHNRVIPETVGYQSFLADYMRSPDVEVTIPGMDSGHSPTTSKDSRHIEGIQPVHATKRLFFKSHGTGRGMSELRGEMQRFKSGTRNTKDLLDALYLALRGNYKPSHGLESRGVLWMPTDRGFTQQTGYDWRLE